MPLLCKAEDTEMNKEWSDVRAFHLAFGHPAPEEPVSLGQDRAEKRCRWMREEIGEFLEAGGDIVEQADAMIDLIYFALGTLVEMGIQPDELFSIVQQANMSKLWPDGKPHYFPDGKTKKPEGWHDPHPELEKAIEAMKKHE